MNFHTTTEAERRALQRMQAGLNSAFERLEEHLR